MHCAFLKDSGCELLTGPYIMVLTTHCPDLEVGWGEYHYALQVFPRARCPGF